MNIIQSGILTLIRSAVTGETGSLPGEFSLQEAYPLIKKHDLIPLACEGAMLCGIPMENPVLPKLMEGYGKSLFISEAQLLAIEGICEAFEANGIDYLPLKGCEMKSLYPKAELRVMGDADILIRMEQYPQIIPIMENLGFTFSEESNHEFVWRSEQLYLELHKCLIPSYNQDYYAYFGDGWRLAQKRCGTRYAMGAEDNFVYLFTHFAKHYRDGGIGCRHVLDLWVYLRANPDMDEERVRSELGRLHLLSFYENIRRLLAVWFEGADGDDRTDFLTEFIFSSGTWGGAEAHILSAEARHAGAAGSAVGGRLRSLRTALFPGKDSMVQQYKTVQKHPGLYPLFWPVRLFDIALFRRDAIRVRQKKWKIASAERLDAYQRSLDYVGLNFRFDTEQDS